MGRAVWLPGPLNPAVCVISDISQVPSNFGRMWSWSLPSLPLAPKSCPREMQPSQRRWHMKCYDFWLWLLAHHDVAPEESDFMVVIKHVCKESTNFSAASHSMFSSMYKKWAPMLKVHFDEYCLLSQSPLPSLGILKYLQRKWCGSSSMENFYRSLEISRN